MAKRNRQEEKQTQSSTAPLAVLVAGGLAVAGLVAWAVTRSMQAPTQTVTPPAITEPAAAPPANTPLPQSTSTSPFQTTTGITPPQTQTQPHVQDAEHAAAPRIDVGDLKAQIASGAVTVIDVRDSVSYTNAHIPGAIHIPLARIEGELNYLPKGKPIVTYCT